MTVWNLFMTLPKAPKNFRIITKGQDGKAVTLTDDYGAMTDIIYDDMKVIYYHYCEETGNCTALV